MFYPQAISKGKISTFTSVYTSDAYFSLPLQLAIENERALVICTHRP